MSVDVPKILYMATTNDGKLREIMEHLSPMGISVRKLGVPFVEVQSDTLEGVIDYGMEELLSRGCSDMTFIKDDSGLFVKALNGFPGVYSAYVLKTLKVEGLLRSMEGLGDRSAHFRTVIGLHEPGKGVRSFTGECRGTISLEKRGKNGFGFDPVFVPEGHDETFAEMTLEQKNALSHRIKALSALEKHLWAGRAASRAPS